MSSTDGALYCGHRVGTVVTSGRGRGPSHGLRPAAGDVAGGRGASQGRGAGVSQGHLPPTVGCTTQSSSGCCAPWVA